MPVTDKAKFAIKTSLSLTLAYMLPMAFGWPQPQTAATTVMLIAATGMVSESLQKGVLRILGTVIGAIILGVINNMLNLLGISPYLQGAVKGLVILIAVLMQYKRAQ